MPPSKSLTNRALVMAAVAGGGEVESPLDCDDTRYLARALERCGWPLTWQEAIRIGSRKGEGESVLLDLGNSGTGARMLLALLAAVPGHFVVDGCARLRERPMGPLLDALAALGARFEAAPGMRLPVEVWGRPLNGDRVAVAPRASSQFVTALLLMAPLTSSGLEVSIEGPIPSRPYLELTRHVLQAFGANVSDRQGGRIWRVEAGGVAPRRYRVEGDWSAAAFFMAAACVAGGRVTIDNLDPESPQGDRRLVDILRRAGAVVDAKAETVTVQGPAARPFKADLSDAPDLFPALAVVAAALPPGSVLIGLENLRHKESDRLFMMIENLRRMGADVAADGSSFEVRRGMASQPEVVEVESASDHRIAMAMAVAALAAGELEIDDDRCVTKSFPSFWREWERLLA